MASNESTRLTSFIASRCAVVLTILIFFYAVVGSLILLGVASGPQAYDQNVFHLPAIRLFAEQLPTPDLSGYNLAMTPGYHLFLAVVDRVVSDDVRVLQFVNSWFGLALVLVVLGNVWRFVGPWAGFVLVSPFLLSGYFLRTGAFINTDNIALLFVTLIVAGVAFKRTTPLRSLALGCISMLAVAVRQIQVWPVGLVLLGGMMASPLAKRTPWLPGVADPDDRRWLNLVAASGAFLMPWLVIAWFAWLWGGLTPPMMAEMHGSNWALVTPAFSLALLACFGIFYLPICISLPLKNLWRSWWVWLSVVVGIMTAVVVPTSYEVSAGVWGGGSLWIMARNLPSIAERSLLLLLLAPLGAVVVSAMIRETIVEGKGRVGIILGVAILGFVAAQSFNPQVMQRYFEPIFLVLLAWLAAAGLKKDRPLGWVFGPGLLGFGQLVLLLPRLGIVSVPT